MVSTLSKVFRYPTYIFIAVGTTLLVFTFAVILPNLSLLFQIIPNQSIALDDKVKLVFSLYKSIQTNFTAFSATYTILVAILFGINVSLFAYFIRRQKALTKGTDSVAGIGGLISGIFGIGCAACGTFILTWILGFIGATGIISFLPLGGGEFGILGVVLLTYSIVTTTKKINQSGVC